MILGTYIPDRKQTQGGHVGRPWNWPAVDHTEAASRLEQRYGMPETVARILARRGYEDDENLWHFLNPRLNRLGDPNVLTDMDRAAARVWKAVDHSETVFVHGDYDVDGITGTAFLTRTLRAAGATVVPFVPRRSEGYGLGKAGIDAAVDAGARVLITVDTGIRAFEAVEEASSRGLDVIVLDHHELGEGLPPAHAVVNPLRDEGGDAFRNLAAVGVAAKFIHAVAALRPSDGIREVYREALQLVALGTIADVVPLTGENRILVAHGLARLGRSEWAGIKALLAVAGLNRGRVSSTDVAFFLGPRINAAGRMGEAADALALLLCDDPAEAFRLAEHLERLNLDRRKAEQTATAEASEVLRREEDLPGAVVQWSDDWPAGVVGIVAGRILDRFNRPAFVISMEGDVGRGSARSRSEFPLPVALERCDDLLRRHGGHAQAAGFEIERRNLEAFRERMDSLAREADWPETSMPFEVDAGVVLEEITPECVGWVERLSPFGRGNPEPLFGCRGARLAEAPSIVGKRHLRLSFRQGAGTVRGIAFNQGERLDELGEGQKVDAVFHVAFDTWRGGNSVQLVVKDLK